MKRYILASKDFDFERIVDIVLELNEGAVTPYMEQRNDYYIVLDCSKDKDYDGYVKNLLLTELYNCHKVEALRMKDLQLYYPDSHIWGIGNLLKRPFGEVKDDVIGQRFTRDKHGLFKKLRRDMLEK